MANYFSIADGNFTDPGVFGRTLDAADATRGSAQKVIDKNLTDLVPFYADAGNYPIYGVAVHLYSRAVSPIGTVDLELLGPTGNSIFAESYDINLFTKYDGTNNLITIHPQNWQILKLTSPVTLPDSGLYTLKIKSSESNEISLVGTDAGIDSVHSTELKVLNGGISQDTPFINSDEDSIRGSLEARFNPPSYGLDSGDFTVEGYYYFHSFSAIWSPLINFGDGWHAGRYAAWGLSYNSAEQRIYFWRNAFNNPRTVVDQVFSTKHPLPAGKWVHVAVSRFGRKLSIWVDGVCVGVQTNNSSFYAAIKKQKLKIGTFLKEGNLYTSDMSVSNIKITKGRSKYNPDFTLKVEPLSLRKDTPFLYADPYIETYLATDINQDLIRLPFDIDAIVFNSLNDTRFTKTGVSGSSLTTANPFNGVADFSLSFSGTSVYTADASYGNFPTGDFTIESWVKPSRADSIRAVCSYSSATSSNKNYYLFNIELLSGVVHAYVAAGAVSYDIYAPLPLPVGLWSHVALVRQNQTVKLYIDGVSVGSVSIPNKLNSIMYPTQPTLTIGGEKNNTKPFEGLISNLRFSQGVAVYTGNFDTSTPPGGANIATPQPLLPISSYNNTPGSLTLQPASYNVALPAERYFNSVTLSTSLTTPFTGSTESSFSFVRSQQDYISIPVSRDSVVNVGNADFTAEAWIYLNSMPTNTDVITTNVDKWPGNYNDHYVIFSVDSPNSGGTGWGAILGSTKISIHGYGDVLCASYDHNMVINTWYHVAFVRKEGYATIYINGAATGNAQKFNTTTESYYLNESTALFSIGTETNNGAYFNGLITNFRLIRGTALYAGDFTTNPFPNQADIANPTPLDVVHFPAGEGVTYSRGVVYPSSRIPHLGVTNSYYFDGTAGHNIYTPNANIGLADFTVEFWIDPIKDQHYGVIFHIPNTQVYITVNDGGALDTSLCVSWPGKAFAKYILPIGQWTHVALVRDNSLKTVTLFINGNVHDTYNITSSNYNINTTSEAISIGSFYNYYSYTYTLVGYIADFRLVRGTAVYPSAAFPTISDTSPRPSVGAGTLSIPLYSQTANIPILSDSYPSTFSTTDGSVIFPGAGGTYIRSGVVSLDSIYTIEAWVKIDGTTGWGNIFNVPGAWRVMINTDYRVYFYNNRNGNYFYSAAKVPLDTWVHIAVCRLNSDISITIDGVSSSLLVTGSLSNLLVSYPTASPAQIGEGLKGSISNARILLGEARYMSAPSAPPTLPGDATVLPSTILLLKGDGATGSTNSNIIATTGQSLTLYGAFQSQETAPDGSSAIIFDQRLNSNNKSSITADVPEANFDTSAFTIECSVRGLFDGYYPIFGKRDNDSNAFCGVIVFLSGRQIIVYISTTGGWASMSSSGSTLIPNQWNHIKIERIPGTNTLKMYHEGVECATYTIPAAVGTLASLRSTSSLISVGQYALSSGYSFKGLIAGFKITKNGSNIFELSHNGTADIVDSSNTFKSIMSGSDNTTGAVSISNTQAKFGNALRFTSKSILKIYGDYNPAMSTAGVFGTGDLTLEAWIYRDGSIDGQELFVIGDENNGIIMRIWNRGDSLWVNNVRYDWYTDINVPLNTWTHVAFVRNSDRFGILINGSLITIRNSNTGVVARTHNVNYKPIFNSRGRILIGWSEYNLNHFVGYMDDIRISKTAVYDIGALSIGVAIPTDPFDANEPNTALLFKHPFINNSLFSFRDSIPFWKTGTQNLRLINPNEVGIKGSGVIPASLGCVLEFWVRPENTRIEDETYIYARGHIIVGANPTTSRGAIGLTGNDRKLWIYDAWRNKYYNSTDRCIVYRSWNYIAVVFKDADVSVYVNGVLQVSYTRPNATTSIDLGYLNIGNSGNAADGLYGSINSVRVRTGDFVNAVPSAPFTVTDDTYYLLKSPFTSYLKPGTSSTHFSNSITPFVDSFNSPVDKSLCFNRYMNSHIKRRHIDDKLRQKSAFTVEGWFNISEDTTADAAIRNIWRNGTGGNFYIIYTQNMYFCVKVNGDIEKARSFIQLTTNKWYYFALTQDDSNVVRLYLSDGDTGTASLVGSFTSTFSIALGNYNQDTYIGEGHTGVISNFKESQGALYTVDGDVSYTKEPRSLDPGTISLLQDSYENNVYSYYEDNSSLLIKPNNNAFSAESPFGVGIDGSINKAYSIVPADFNPDLNLGSKAFTLEWWDNIHEFTSNCFPIVQFGSVFAQGGVLSVRYYKAGTVIKLQLRYGGNLAEFILPKDFALDVWRHCALVRYDDYIHLYINGVFHSRISIGQYIFDSPQNTGIVGAFYDSSVASDSALRTINGYISNVRLVVDQTLYPAPAPISPLDNIEGTVFLYQAPYASQFQSNASVGSVSLVSIRSPLEFDPNPSTIETDEDCMLFNNKRYLRITDTGPTYDIGASNEPFTLECWVYAISNTGVQMILSRGGGQNSWGRFGYSYTLHLIGGTLRWAACKGVNTPIVLDYAKFGQKYLRQWVHVAITYNGSITRMHVNGVEEITYSAPHLYYYNQRNKYNFKLGDDHIYNNRYSDRRFFGYLSNVRIIKGINLYNSSTFIPSRHLSNTLETVLLLQAPYNNNVEFKLQSSPFQVDDVDRLTLLDGAKYLKTLNALPVLAGDFTIEFWFYTLREQHFNTISKESVIDGRSSGISAAPFIVRFNDTPGKITVYTGRSVDATGNTSITVGNIVPNTWSHFAMVRKDFTVNLYQDGVLGGSFYDSATWGGNQLLIGKQYAGFGYGENNYFGYLSNIRILNGEAAYGATYTVSTSPLTAEPDTTFLLKTGINLNKCLITTQSPSINDEIQPVRLKDANFTAQIEGSPWSTLDRDFIALNYDKFLRFAPDQSFDIYQSAFTFETWLMRLIDIDCVNRIQTIIHTGNFMLYLDCNNNLIFYNGGTYATDVEIPLNEWVHIAIVHSPSDEVETMHLYINGVRSWTWRGVSQMPAEASVKSIVIGTYITEYPWWGATYNFIGNISNLRIARGEVSRTVTDSTGNFAFNPGTKIYVVKDSPNPTLSPSVFFDGQNNSYISSTSKSCEFLGQFTIELYVKADLTLVGSPEFFVESRDNWGVRIYSNGAVSFIYRTSTNVLVDIPTAAGVIATDTWTHIAVSRNSSNDINIYVDKLLVASEVESRQIGRSINKLFLLGYPSTRFYLCGLKINKAECLYDDPIINPPFPLVADSGNVSLLISSQLTEEYTPPYTTDFTPPVGPLTPIPGTVLLLQTPHNVNNTVHYTGFNAEVVGNVNPYTGSSAYRFSGRSGGVASAADEGGDFIQAYADDRFQYTLTTKFAVQMWINPSVLANQPYPRWYNVLPNNWNFYYLRDLRGWRCLINKPSTYSVHLRPDNYLRLTVASGAQYISDKPVIADRWTHIAYVCNGSKILLFIDGVVVNVHATTAPSASYNTGLTIGTSSVNRGAGTYWNCGDPNWCLYHYTVSNPYFGMISDIQITKDNQIYGTNLDLEGFYYTLATGTVFQYQPNPTYEIYNYQTAAGDASFVINSTIPDDNDGIFFPGLSATYIKTQPLPAIPDEVLVELWFKSTRTTTPVAEILLDARNSNTDVPWYIMLNKTKSKSIAFSFGAGKTVETGTDAYRTNIWCNIAVIRKQGIITMYINGAPIASLPSTTVWPAQALHLGRAWDGKYAYKGYIFSARIVKDNAVYDVSFSPSTLGAPSHIPTASLTTSEPLFAGTNVTDTTGKVSRNAYLRYDIGVSTSSLNPVSPYSNTDNILFFNYNQSIIIPGNERMDVANMPWSFEVWVYLTGDTGQRKTIIRKGEGNAQSYALYCNTNRTITFVANGAIVDPNTGAVTQTTLPSTTNTTALPIFKWVHLMVTSDGSTTELFINGKYNFTYNYTPQINVDTPLYVGGTGNTADHFTGYMSNLRLIKNENAFTTAIDVPLNPFPDNNIDDPDYDMVTLLLHGNGSDNSTTIIDTSSYSHTIIPHGDCRLRAITNKFGFSSIYFGKTGDYITGLPSFTNAGKFGDQDFTIEFWVYAESAPQNDQTILSANIYPRTSGLSVKYRRTTLEVCAGSTVVISSTKWSLNAWHYIAISRVSGNLKLFIDGDFIKSVAWGNYCSDGLQYIGRSTWSPSNGLIGYIDDLRITNGKGRYNSDFTPPTSPVSTIFNTAVVLQAPYEDYTYGTYLLEGVHISSTILNSVCEPRYIELTDDARVNNLYIHNKGTLHVSKTVDAYLDVVGANGIQITSEGSLNIN